MHLNPGFLKSILPVFGLYLLIQNAIAQETPVAGLSAADSIKVETLLSQMTLDEKTGQLSLFASGWDVTGPTLNSDYRQLIRDGKAGAILNANTVDYVKSLQRVAVEESRLKIPLIFGSLGGK